MKACKNCSASLDDGERYCPNCGDAAPAWSDATVVAAWCCGLVGFAIGVVGAFQSYLGIYALLENVGAPPVPQEFSQSKGESVAFLLELLLAIAVLVWLYRPRTLARWHPALRVGVLAVCIGFLGLTSVCNVFSIWNL